MAEIYTAKYTANYTSFSGADIVATFNGIIMGELQAISFSVTREKVPIYVMGRPDPVSFSRGKRGIAGSLVFTNFDRDVFTNLKDSDINTQGANFVTAYANTLVNMGNTSPEEGSVNNFGVLSPEQWEKAMNDRLTARGSSFAQQAARYSDEIMPFDVTITMKNEYGQAATFSILGVEILNEGSGMSIDDITTERACTFVARGLTPLKPVTGEAAIFSTSVINRNNL